MLVGILSGESVSQLHALSRNAPLPLINPLIVYLTHPDDKVSAQYVHSIQGRETTILLRPVMYRHLFNPDTGVQEYVAGFALPKDPDMSSHRFGVVYPVPDFVPYARLCLDGMRSYSSRAFCRSYSNALTGYELEFTLAWAERGNEQHASLFDDFNSEAGVQLEQSQAIGDNL